MNLSGLAIGRADFTVPSICFAEAGAFPAAALTFASALGPAAIRPARSLGREGSAVQRSITVSPSTRPRAGPLPFSNIISFIAVLPSFPVFGLVKLGPSAAGCRPACQDPGVSDMSNLQTDSARLWDSLMETAAIGGTLKGGICRLTLTDLDGEVRA